MSTTQAEFRARLQSLADKFKANADEHLAASYAEAMARRQFKEPKSSIIRRAARRAETMAVGIPVPGCVLAPAKYRLW